MYSIARRSFTGNNGKKVRAEFRRGGRAGKPYIGPTAGARESQKFLICRVFTGYL